MFRTGVVVWFVVVAPGSVSRICEILAQVVERHRDRERRAA
jgi:hypothetical protein